MAGAAQLVGRHPKFLVSSIPSEDTCLSPLQVRSPIREPTKINQLFLSLSLSLSLPAPLFKPSTKAIKKNVFK